MRKIRIKRRAEASLPEDAQASARTLGLVLRNARTKRALSRKQFGDRVLIAPATLQRMEAGDPRVSLGYYLAAGSELGVPVLTNSGAVGLESILGSLKPRAARKRKSDWFS